jgi:hypothetical protein
MGGSSPPRPAIEPGFFQSLAHRRRAELQLRQRGLPAELLQFVVAMTDSAHPFGALAGKNAELGGGRSRIDGKNPAVPNAHSARPPGQKEFTLSSAGVARFRRRGGAKAQNGTCLAKHFAEKMFSWSRVGSVLHSLQIVEFDYEVIACSGYRLLANTSTLRSCGKSVV